MHRDLFHYDLPPELIAQHPPVARRDARLLSLDGESGALGDHQITEFGDFIEPGDLLVFNDTRVIPARLFGAKETGGKVELLIERVLSDEHVLAYAKSSKALKPGAKVLIAAGVAFEFLHREENLFRLAKRSARSLDDILTEFGHVPLPPYIEREDESFDIERYQTVYARVPGAVAAPTAGLHFDQEQIAEFHDKGIECAFLTLHVGAGTFQPVRVDNVEEHHMHREYIDVSASLCAQVARVRAAGKRVIAVGTTSVRALESAAKNGELQAMQGETDIFIVPGYEFQIVDAMLTNFHLPESTLLMLISAFAGRERVLAAYEHAIAQAYRFFSYGDAMFLTRAQHASPPS